MTSRLIAQQPVDDSKSGRVKQHILERIVRGELQPGDIINRREIAQEVGVSVTPVLEAMVQLQNDGFIEVLPRKITRVRVMKPDELYGQLLFREALECQVARLLAERADQVDAEPLEQLAVVADSTAEEWPQSLDNEAAFHGALARSTGCALLVHHLENVLLTSLFFQLHNSIPSPHLGSHKSHVLLLKSILAGDGAAADQAVRDHLSSEHEYLSAMNWRQRGSV